jgi:hypothetical protein
VGIMRFGDSVVAHAIRARVTGAAGSTCRRVPATSERTNASAS